MLDNWHEFYELLGTAAAALLSLLFVVASIGANAMTPETAGGTRTFMSPVAFHYANVLFLGLVALIPTQTWESFGLTLAVAAAGSLAYSLVILVRVLRDSRADMVDNFAYGAVPAVCYMRGSRLVSPYPERVRSGPRGAGRRGAVVARRQYPQRLGPDAVDGAPVRKPQPAAVTSVTLILLPARILASVFTSPSAFAQILQGLASRVSSPFEIGVRPKPMAMAWPSGQ